jgi:hypothetical protein
MLVGKLAFVGKHKRWHIPEQCHNESLIFIKVCKQSWKMVNQLNLFGSACQSFHRKGKSMMARSITSISEPNNNKILAVGTGMLVTNTALDTFIKTKSWGTMMGKPSMAMIAAFCCAFAAMAAKKVKTRLRLQLPRKVIPMKGHVLLTG